MAKEKLAQKEPVDVSVSGILGMLQNGIDRKGIAEHYGLPMATLKRIMAGHPKLKGAKVRPTVPVRLIDDTVEGAPVVTDFGKPQPVAATTEATVENTEALAPAQPQAATQEAAAPVAQATQETPAPQAAAQPANGLW